MLTLRRLCIKTKVVFTKLTKNFQVFIVYKLPFLFLFNSSYHSNAP